MTSLFAFLMLDFYHNHSVSAMSLEATHLRFSLAIKDDLGGVDMEKYVAGTIYPDSRYMSGIERTLTHSLDYFQGRKNLTDFEKGWLSHIIGDKVFKGVMEEKFPDLVLSEDFEQRWAIITAIKIVQDIRDFASFDIQLIIDLLDYYEIHFHEDERLVIRYNNIIRDMYKGKEKLTVEDCLGMWKKLGMNEKETIFLKKRLVELYDDERLIESINENFQDGLDFYEDKYRGLAGQYKK